MPLSAVVTLPSTAGNYGLEVVTNASASVFEANTSNNTQSATGPIQVAQAALPDLVVTSITPPNNGVLSGITVPVTFTVQNQGTGPTSASGWSDAVYLSQIQIPRPTSSPGRTT